MRYLPETPVVLTRDSVPAQPRSQCGLPKSGLSLEARTECANQSLHLSRANCTLEACANTWPDPSWWRACEP